MPASIFIKVPVLPWLHGKEEKGLLHKAALWVCSHGPMFCTTLPLMPSATRPRLLC